MREAPTPIPGRKGQQSVANIVIHALWPQSAIAEPPSKSLGDLQAICSKTLAFDMPSSTLRSILYRRPEIFEKADKTGGKTCYRLTKNFIESSNEE